MRSAADCSLEGEGEEVREVLQQQSFLSKVDDQSQGLKNITLREPRWSKMTVAPVAADAAHSDIDIYLTAGLHTVSEFLSGPAFCHTMDTAEVIH